MDDPGALDEAVIREALRLHQRYAEEIVEQFSVCPWARHAREAGQWERLVLLQRDEAIEPTLDFIARLEARPEIPVAIAIYPRLTLTPHQFDDFAARIRSADQARHGGRPILVAATFHPDYTLNPRSPSAMVPFFRRSPDRSLQLIRLDVLDEARGPAHGKFVFDFSPEAWARLREQQARPSVTERITADNAARLEGEGRARFEEIYRDLFADRDRTYARLGERR